MNTKKNEQTAMRVSILSIILNIILAAFKVAAGFIAGSSAMISDGVHSASDVFSTVGVMIGIKAANRESDENHPYGHERMECIAAILLAVMLCAVGAGIGYAGIMKIASGDYASLPIPGALALVAAIISIAVKEGMFWYTRWAGKKINSGALMADAWHHRSDALSSVGSFIGIAGARMGIPVLDPAASVLIAVMIIKASIDIFRDAVSKMTDQACEPQVVSEMEQLIENHSGVVAIDEIKTRMFGNVVYVDVEIQADAQITLDRAHEIAERLHDKMEAAFPQVKHCMIHVNPDSRSH